jgi:hypothetical protein
MITVDSKQHYCVMQAQAEAVSAQPSILDASPNIYDNPPPLTQTLFSPPAAASADSAGPSGSGGVTATSLAAGIGVFALAGVFLFTEFGGLGGSAPTSQVRWQIVLFFPLFLKQRTRRLRPGSTDRFADSLFMQNAWLGCLRLPAYFCLQSSVASAVGPHISGEGEIVLLFCFVYDLPFQNLVGGGLGDSPPTISGEGEIVLFFTLCM